MLAYSGTNANDTFRVLNAAGDVLLNNRLVLAATGVESLTMEGLLGDDLFDIVPSIPSLAYGLVNTNGGALKPQPPGTERGFVRLPGAGRHCGEWADRQPRRQDCRLIRG